MIKNFKPMICPICGEYYFDDDSELEKNEPDYIGKADDYCRHCGWKYDLYEVENPDSDKGINNISLNNYKKLFASKIKENPQYDYFDEHYNSVQHICPVCHKYMFKSISSFDTCPYCGWEDDALMESEPQKWAGSSNDLCLDDFIDRYEKLVKSIPKYKYKKHGFSI